MIRYQLLLFIFLGINSLLMAQSREINAEKTAIQSSRYWLDIDYVGDGHIGHRLDVQLPAKGKSLFRLSSAYTEVPGFPTIPKGLFLAQVWDRSCSMRVLRW